MKESGDCRPEEQRQQDADWLSLWRDCRMLRAAAVAAALDGGCRTVPGEATGSHLRVLRKRRSRPSCQGSPFDRVSHGWLGCTSASVLQLFETTLGDTLDDERAIKEECSFSTNASATRESIACQLAPPIRPLR
jgi:hypothetical protein